MNQESTDTLHHSEAAEAFRTKVAHYKNVLAAWWWIPLLTVGIGLLFQTWAALNKPVVYSSNGRIIVGGRVSLPDSAAFNEESMNFFGTQIELMQSPQVRQQATARVHSLKPDLQPVPVAINASQIPRSAVFVLSASGSEPEYVRAYLDAVMEEYIATRRNMANDQSRAALAAMTEAVHRIENDLQTSEQEILDWQKKNNLTFLKEQSALAATYLAKLNQELAQLKSEEKLLESLDLDQTLERKNEGSETATNGSTESAAESAPISGAVSRAGPETEYLQARQKLAMLEAQRGSKLVTYRPAHDEIQILDSEIKQQQEFIKILGEQSREKLKSTLDSIKKQIATKEIDIEEHEKKAINFSERMGEFERKQWQLDRTKMIFERLVANMKNVDVNTDVQQDIVRIMEPASPAVEHRTSIARELTSGSLVGLAVGAGLIFLIGFLDDRIASISELQAVFKEEVIGIIPKADLSQSSLLLNDEDDTHATVEAFRNIRSWIFFTPWEGKRPKTFLITSSIPSEGKSTVAANLALALASAGSKTLLVDGDIRRGQVHHIFDIDPQPGFGDVLSDGGTLEDIVIETKIPHLSVIPRGRYPAVLGNEVFFGRSIYKFIEDIEAKYDHIVFDSSPILAVDDTSSLAPKVDVVFFVVRSSFTRIRLAKKALSNLGARRANVQGIIYNAVDWSASDYPYYRYGYSYRDEPGKVPS